MLYWNSVNLIGFFFVSVELIVSSRKFDVLKTTIFLRSEV